MRAITQCGLSLSCLETIQEGNLSRSLGGKWCGRGDLNPHGQSPTDFLTSYGFRRHDAGPKAVGALFVVWTIPSPCRPEGGLGAARLVSTPSCLGKEAGLARDRHAKGFPEFEQFYVARFRARTRIGAFKSVASTDFATPAHAPVRGNAAI